MGKRIPLPPPRTVPLRDAVSEAYSEFQSLAEEMRDWANNMEEHFSQTDKYSRVSEAADALEDLQEPDVPESVADIPVTIQDPKPQKGGYSRSFRCSQAGSILMDCIAALEEVKNEEGVSDEKSDDADQLMSELEQHQGDSESVDFPGMFG